MTYFDECARFEHGSLAFEYAVTINGIAFADPDLDKELLCRFANRAGVTDLVIAYKAMKYDKENRPN